jgi:hypothetical protein
MDAVTVEVSLPGEKFVDRDVVEAAGFFDRDIAAAHCLNDRRLAPNRPALVRLR